MPVKKSTSKRLQYYGCLFFLLFFLSCFWSLFLAPTDGEMGEGYRVIFVHVPSAFMSLLIYIIMGVCALATQIIRRPKTVQRLNQLIYALAPIGAWMTFLALVTGAIWGKRMWGTWWTWHDARLVSELILLFLYLGYLLLIANIPSRETANKIGAIVLTLGLINIPIIHFSVTWWTSLHQPPTLLRFDKPAMDSAMLYPLLVMIGCFIMYVTLCTWLSVKIQVLNSRKR